MRDRDVEDPLEGLCGHAGAEAEADREGQAKAHGMQVVVNAVQIDRCILGAGHREIFGCEVILSEEVVQLELAGVAGRAHGLLFGRQCRQVAFVDRAVFVRALVGRADAVLFPSEQSVATVRTPVTRFAFAA